MGRIELPSKHQKAIIVVLYAYLSLWYLRNHLIVLIQQNYLFRLVTGKILEKILS